MFKICSALVILSVSYSTSWVFNNVDIAELAAKSVDMDNVGDDGDNEIDIDEDFLQQRFNLIYPGTKWCGAGNVAENDTDLGYASESDKCCREHDMCSDVILAGDTMYNLTNDAFYTRLSCECDERFRRCLHMVGSKTSHVIGKMYFNAIGTKCFREDYPVTGCKRKGGWLNRKCVEYSYDTNGNRRVQWFDVPNY